MSANDGARAGKPHRERLPLNKSSEKRKSRPRVRIRLDDGREEDVGYSSTSRPGATSNRRPP